MSSLLVARRLGAWCTRSLPLPSAKGTSSPLSRFRAFDSLTGELHEPGVLAHDHVRTASDIIWELNQGNKRFVAQRQAGNSSGGRLSEVPPVDRFIEDPLRAPEVKAIVCGDSRASLPMANVFDTRPGELQVLRVCGTVLSRQDGVVGSLEFLVEQVSPPVLLIMGQSQNDVVESAVHAVMLEAGRTDIPFGTPSKTVTDKLHLVNQVLPAAQDAIHEQPQASFETLCELTSQLSIWQSIEAVFRSSRMIADGAAAGKFEVHGAYLRQTGRVQFLGEHPSKQILLQDKPSLEAIRTAQDAPVPAAEALALLYVGNRRYAVGKGGQMLLHDERVRFRLSESGQNPIAVVVGCADSRAPIEIMFDCPPGDLFVLRNAGNTTHNQGCSLIGSAEYAITQLRSKLVLVLGHTQCGAVTAAVQLARQRTAADTETNIGRVLREITKSAEKAVEMLPEGTLGEQVKLATRLNIFDTMKKMIVNSPIIKQGASLMDVHVQGAIYDLYTGQVQWLGPHPDLEELVDQQMPMFQWKVNPYIPGKSVVTFHGEAAEALKVLREGNDRFVRGESAHHIFSGKAAQRPIALLVGGGEARMPLEKVFDVGEGSVVVQRTLGGFENSEFGIDTPTASIEYAIVRYDLKLLVVLGESDSKIVDEALVQIDGAEAPSRPMQRILVDVMVNALRAVGQVDNENMRTSAGRKRKVKQLTVELNTLYMIKKLLVSKTIRGAVRNGLQLHAAVLNRQTGRVEFFGEHPMQEEIIKQFEAKDSLQ
eukprot:CAMPEP_0171071488 /NCGR_PEP_ID=MMETSP0766_2-20121228/10348_1 /TAXON_ID=439317 /ORGANISM="Gambierdiscus australes, Strain CAWD 149" /LENGTH=763 /DNA_ID=CAMNT_0011528031 /DNA_START=39 /DNA_END=2330 /DNA_ORIENTATION=-